MCCHLGAPRLGDSSCGSAGSLAQRQDYRGRCQRRSGYWIVSADLPEIMTLRFEKCQRCVMEFGFQTGRTRKQRCFVGGAICAAVLAQAVHVSAECRRC